MDTHLLKCKIPCRNTLIPILEIDWNIGIDASLISSGVLLRAVKRSNEHLYYTLCFIS